MVEGQAEGGSARPAEGRRPLCVYVTTPGGVGRCWEGERKSRSAASVAGQNSELVDEVRCRFVQPELGGLRVTGS